MSQALDAIERELSRARRAHEHNISSPHEAIAIIREEYLETESEVFQRDIVRPRLLKELTQLAAMCARSIEDLGLIP